VNETCVQYGDEGATCSTNLPCRPDLGCVGGMCGTPSANGVTCASSAECDQLNGSFCDPLSKQCGAVGFAQPSGTCGLVDGGITVCAGPGSLCGNETEAQDIVQDTFLQAIRSIHRFQGRSSVYTWLHAILLNLSRHYHRDRKRIVYDDELADREAPPDPS